MATMVHRRWGRRSDIEESEARDGGAPDQSRFSSWSCHGEASGGGSNVVIDARGEMVGSGRGDGVGCVAAEEEGKEEEEKKEENVES
jgi:hypothetical protein